MGIFFKSKKERELKKEAESLAPQLLRQVNESIDLINDTKNPETFFFRYDFLTKRLRQLMDFEKVMIFTGEGPSIAFERVMADKPMMINTFLERYCDDVLAKARKLKTDKARKKRVEDFVLSVRPYLDSMEKSNIDTFNELILFLEDELELL